MTNEQLKLEVEGLGDCVVTGSHEDVNGKWGGYKAWVVHYESETMKRHELYRHVGEYYDVGNWPGDYGPSKWEVMNRCVDFINGEVSLTESCRVLFEYHIKRKWGKIGHLLLTLCNFKSSISRSFNNWRQCNR
jgi:hypothetical protein